MKKSDVLDLIKYHYEGRETEFRNQSIAIEMCIRDRDKLVLKKQHLPSLLDQTYLSLCLVNFV